MANSSSRGSGIESILANIIVLMIFLFMFYALYHLVMWIIRESAKFIANWIEKRRQKKAMRTAS